MMLNVQCLNWQEQQNDVASHKHADAHWETGGFNLWLSAKVNIEKKHYGDKCHGEEENQEY